MRCLLFCLGLLLLGESAFADALRCDADAGPVQKPLIEGQADVAAESFDAGLSPGSVFYAVQDSALHHRAAFTGSGLSFSVEGALLETSTEHVLCHVAPDKLNLAPPPGGEQADYLACVLDTVKFEGGAPGDSTRHFLKLTSPIHPTFPLEVREEDSAVAFHVHYLSYDPAHGLDVTLTDKASGEVAHYSGPARSMQKSFLLGLTIGDREVSARFLRLGCVWTNDPKALGSPTN